MQMAQHRGNTVSFNYSSGNLATLKDLLLYLFSEALSVLQTVYDGLDQKVAAAFAQSVVVLTFLTGLGQQSHPNFGHRVSTGILPEHRNTQRRNKNRTTRQLAQTNQSYMLFLLPFNPQSEPFGKFLQGTGVLALNLPPSPQVVGHVLQLLSLLLKLQI